MKLWKSEGLGWWTLRVLELGNKLLVYPPPPPLAPIMLGGIPEGGGGGGGAGGGPEELLDDDMLLRLLGRWNCEEEDPTVVFVAVGMETNMLLTG